MSKKNFIYLFILLIILMDQWSKTLLTKVLTPGASHPVIENFFHISYVKNSGAAFSILQDKTLYLLVATVIILILANIYFVMNLKKNPLIVSVALAMIIGGGIGNLLDRWRLGYVIDFIDFRVFPVFNVADIFVTLGCFSLILYLIIKEKKSGEKEEVWKED